MRKSRDKTDLGILYNFHMSDPSKILSSFVTSDDVDTPSTARIWQSYSSDPCHDHDDQVAPGSFMFAPPTHARARTSGTRLAKGTSLASNHRHIRN